MKGIRERARLPIIVAAALASSLATASAAPAFDIDDLLAPPQPEQLVAAADAPLIAWVGNERGVRNLWAARAPRFEPRRLSTYDRDDGQLLSGLQLSRDGRWLVYVRGNKADPSGQEGNPDGDPDGREQAVWAVATDGAGAPHRRGRRGVIVAARRRGGGATVARARLPRLAGRRAAVVVQARAAEPARPQPRRRVLARRAHAGLRQRSRRPRLRRRARPGRARCAGWARTSTATASRRSRPTVAASRSCASPPAARRRLTT
nr:hypothetical protein [Lysobacter enzymogenes]